MLPPAGSACRRRRCGSRSRSLVLASAVAAPKRETDPKKRVVITGMGLVSVFGNDVDAYYERLLEGESGIGLIDRFDASKFPTRFAGQIKGFSSEGYIDGKNDRRLDDCLRYCLVSGKKALENAGLHLGSPNMEKVMGWLSHPHFLNELLLFRSSVLLDVHFFLLCMHVVSLQACSFLRGRVFCSEFFEVRQACVFRPAATC